MMLARRGFLAGLLAAPAIVRTPGLLMPIKPAIVWTPLYSELQAITQRAIIPTLQVRVYRGLPMWSAWVGKGA